MKTATDFLRLIRLPNLIIIAGTQYLVRYMLIKPMVELNKFELQFSDVHFVMLMIATLLIAAAGYIINDYFDIRIDRENDPESLIVGKSVNRRLAMLLHSAFTGTGILLGLYISYANGMVIFGILFVLCGVLLWYYSTFYKHKMIIGNIIVSFLAALVPLIVALFEIPLLVIKYRDTLLKYDINFNYILYWVFGYAFFAFLTNLIREIIKDIEDIKGDDACGSKTLPVVIGIKNTRLIVITLAVAATAFLAYIQINFIHDAVSVIYFIAFLYVPFAILFYKLFYAEEKKDYRIASNVTKVIMLGGILYIIVLNNVPWLWIMMV